MTKRAWVTASVLILAGCAMVLLAWWQWPSVMVHRVDALDQGQKNQLPAAGQLGDSFGALTVVLTGLTVVGVAFSLWYQRKEVVRARNEAEEERKARSEDATERHFFQLLEVCREHVARITNDGTAGPEALRLHATRYLEIFDEAARPVLPKAPTGNLLGPVQQSLDQGRARAILRPFFETFYLLIEHVLAHSPSSGTDSEKRLAQRLLKVLGTTFGADVVGLAVMHARILGHDREQLLMREFCRWVPTDFPTAPKLLAWALLPRIPETTR